MITYYIKGLPGKPGAKGDKGDPGPVHVNFLTRMWRKLYELRFRS